MAHTMTHKSGKGLNFGRGEDLRAQYSDLIKGLKQANDAPGWQEKEKV